MRKKEFKKRIKIKINTKKRNKIAAIPLDPFMTFQIEDYLRESKDEYKAKRDCMLLHIGLTTGYRLQDVVDLTIGDLKRFMENGYFLIREKKKINALKAKLEGYEYVAENDDGDEVVISADEVLSRTVKPREAEIIEELYPLLEEYVRGEKDRNYAFRTTKCERIIKEKGNAPFISREAYSKIISNAAKEVAKRTKEKDISKAIGITGHSLRKGYALNIYETTEDINKVKELLGHSSVEVTKLYLGFNKKMHHEASTGLNKFIRKSGLNKFIRNN